MSLQITLNTEKIEKIIFLALYITTYRDVIQSLQKFTFFANQTVSCLWKRKIPINSLRKFGEIWPTGASLISRRQKDDTFHCCGGISADQLSYITDYPIRNADGTALWQCT